MLAPDPGREPSWGEAPFATLGSASGPAQVGPFRFCQRAAKLVLPCARLGVIQWSRQLLSARDAVRALPFSPLTIRTALRCTVQSLAH
jgi:hypothetical protein